MDQSQIAPILTALAALVAAITALVGALHNGRKLTTIHEQTNATLTALTAKADLATEQRATAAELDARPPLTGPKLP